MGTLTSNLLMLVLMLLLPLKERFLQHVFFSLGGTEYSVGRSVVAVHHRPSGRATNDEQSDEWE